MALLFKFLISKSDTVFQMCYVLHKRYLRIKWEKMGGRSILVVHKAHKTASIKASAFFIFYNFKESDLGLQKYLLGFSFACAPFLKNCDLVNVAERCWKNRKIILQRN